MAEMPSPREHHGQPALVGGGYHLGVADRAAGLDDRGRAGRRNCVEAVTKWKERV